MRNPEGIARVLREAGSVCICCHVNPDGDTVGSALAMRLILEGMGKHVRVFCQDKIPDHLAFLSGAGEVLRPEEDTGKYDLFLAVDVSDTGRLGSCDLLRKRCTHSAQIDHHGTNPGYTEVNSVDGEASATCCLIREQMKVLHVPMTKEIAECLYVGVSTDTGNFSFDCTNSEAFRVMSDLMDTGFRLAELNMILFREKSKPQLRLLGKAISGMRFEADGQIAVMTLTQKDFRECGALSEHADTLVNYALESQGTRMALLARENDDGMIKLSLRARAPLTVDDVAAGLGGGGHARAAGISMEGSLQATTERVLKAMKERLQKENT